MKVKELYTGKIVKFGYSEWKVEVTDDKYIFTNMNTIASMNATIMISRIPDANRIGVTYQDSIRMGVDDILIDDLMNNGMCWELEKIYSWICV